MAPMQDHRSSLFAQLSGSVFMFATWDMPCDSAVVESDGRLCEILGRNLCLLSARGKRDYIGSETTQPIPLASVRGFGMMAS